MSVTLLSSHRKYKQILSVGARRHWYSVSAGSIWKRYSDSQWLVIPAEQLEFQFREHRAKRRDALSRGNTDAAVFHAEHLMDLEAAVSELLEAVA